VTGCGHNKNNNTKKNAARGRTAETVKREKARGQVVEQILAKLEKTLSTQKVKATLGDYIRLVQLRRELGDAEPREIRVTWVDGENEPETESDSGE
jgi:hypothetical protein